MEKIQTTEQIEKTNRYWVTMLFASKNDRIACDIYSSLLFT